MITIICATNRPDNTTSKICDFYLQMLKEKGHDAAMLSLEDLPKDFAFNNDVYGIQSGDFHRIVEQFIAPAEKLMIVSPEYNGSIPGVLKAFIDGIWPEVLQSKKIALAGVASGRGGNSRGMDHLTSILHYMNIHVLPFKVPISGVDSLLDEHGALVDDKTGDLIEKQIDQLVVF